MRVVEFDVHQKYYYDKYFIEGTDLALAVVEIEEEGQALEGVLRSIWENVSIPRPSAFDGDYLTEIHDKYIEVPGYPVQFFKPATQLSDCILE